MSGVDELTRRSVLEATGGAILGGGSLLGREDVIPVHVGYAERTGGRTAASLARATVREFAFDALTIRIDREEALRLARRDDVRYVEPVRRVTASSTPIDGSVDRVDADVAHANDATASGAHVAVLDTGVDGQHDALVPNLGPGTAFESTRYLFSAGWADDNGHGTHCAGIVGAADPHGVAPGVTIHPVKVLDHAGRGTTDDLAAGLQHVADRGWDVANVSVGGAKSKVVADACAYAAEAGVVLVAAAGPPERGFPAREPECLSVGAATPAGSAAPFSPRDGSVDLLAPGVGVRSTDPGGYATRTGTSMACAHASGAAALLAAQGRSRSEVESRLSTTAEDLGLSPEASGAGLLDVAASLGHDSDDDR